MIPLVEASQRIDGVGGFAKFLGTATVMFTVLGGMTALTLVMATTLGNGVTTVMAYAAIVADTACYTCKPGLPTDGNKLFEKFCCRLPTGFCHSCLFSYLSSDNGQLCTSLRPHHNGNKSIYKLIFVTEHHIYGCSCGIGVFKRKDS